METEVESIEAAVATAGVSEVARARCPGADLPVGCEVPSAEVGGPEDTAWATTFISDTISMELKWFEDGRLYLGLSKSLAGV